MAVQNIIARQFIHVFLDLVVLYYDNHEVHSREELVEIMILVWNHIRFNEWVINL